MKIVVIGGTGLIGRNLVARLAALRHEAVAASPSLGVDTVTGAGLPEALHGAEVVVDVSNAPSFEDAAVLRFFEASTRNLLRATQAAGVGHYVALSVVGADRLPNSGYMRAKVAQEGLITGGPAPYTIVRATQFFEFARAIADSGTDGGVVRLPPAMMQPIAADDVAAALAEVALGRPHGRILDLAGPEPIRMDAFVRRALQAIDDEREVTADPDAGYFGARVDDRSLVPLDEAMLAPTTLDRWLSRAPAPA